MNPPLFKELRAEFPTGAADEALNRDAKACRRRMLAARPMTRRNNFMWPTTQVARECAPPHHWRWLWV